MRRLTRREMLRLTGLGVLSLATGCAPRVETPGPAAVPPTPSASAPSPTAPARAAVPPTTNPAPTAVATKEPGGRVRPFITPNSDLYVQTKSGGEAPQVDTATWQLSFEGLVNNPFTLTLDEVMKLPAREEMRTLECIGNPAGGDLIGNVVWTGTALRPLLERAGLKPEVSEVVLRCVDGYHTSLPREVLLRDDTLLVYKMNGAPLPREHGFPLRLSLAGRYGQKQPKWLTRLEAVRDPYLGYYERQGWSNECFIRPNSIIDNPVDFEPTPLGELTLRGVGMAGEAGVESVEVSLDDGQTWLPTTLQRGPSPLVWVVWETRWTPPAPGKYPMLARLTDRKGDKQVKAGASFSLLGPAFPDGSNEMQRITALIVAPKSS